MNAIPKSEIFLNENELNDLDNELIFVQHSKDINIEEIEKNVKSHFSNRKHKKNNLIEINNQKFYPIAFGNGELILNRPIDHYFLNLPQEN